MKRKNKNTIIISRTFFPIEGGIQTYLLEVAKRWDLGKTRVYCRRENDISDLLHKPVYIRRFNYRNKKYIYSLYQILRVLFCGKKRNFLILIKFIYFFLLMINRFATIEISDFTNNLIRDIEKDNYRCDVIQTSVPIYTGLAGLLLKLRYNIPLVVYIHGRELISTSQNRRMKLLHKFLFKYSDLIISNSRYTKELAKELGAEDKKIKVVNLGANTEKYYPKDTRKKIKKKYGIPKNHKIIYTISHLIPRKGNDMVIKSLPLILQDYKNLTYLIGGRGEYKNKLQELVDKNNLQDHVKFIGFVPDEELNDVMNACDIFVMPNRKEKNDVEGYGIVFMEANACKKPAIAGNSGGATDAILDGKNGLLVDPLSKTDIADKIKYLLKNPKKNKAMGQFGYSLVKNERNWYNVTESIKNYINKSIVNYFKTKRQNN